MADTTYKTGRQPTLTFHGTMTGDEHAEFGFIVTGTPHSILGPTQLCDWDIQFPVTGGLGLPFFGMFHVKGTSAFTVLGASAELKVDMEVDCYWGTAGTNTGTVTMPITPPPYGSLIAVDIHLTGGTWSYSVDCEELETISTPASAALSAGDYNADGYPKYGGSDFVDPPLMTGKNLSLQTKVGGTVTVQCNIGGLSLSQTGTILTAIPMNYQPSASLTASAYRATTAAIATTVKYSAGGSDVDITAPYYLADATHTADCNSGVSVSATSGGVGSRTVTCGLLAAPPKNYNLTGEILAWKDAFPSSVNYRMDMTQSLLAQLRTATGGVISETGSQLTYAVQTSFDGTLQALPTGYSNASEWIALKMWLDSAWLSSNSEDANDWRLMQRGRYFASGTLQHNTQTVDDGSTLTPGTGDFKGTWTAGTNTTASIVAGAVRATISGGTGKITRTFSDFSSSWSGASMMGGRYLTLSLKASTSGQTFQLQIVTPNGTKTWDTDYQGNSLTFPTALGNLIIDLCAPTSATLTTDSKDSRYPYQRTRGRVYVTDSDLWGISNPTSLVFANLPDGHDYDFDSITLDRLDHARQTWQPSYKLWYNSDGSSIGTDDYRPFGDIDVDGRRSREEVDFLRNAITYTQRTLSEIWASLTGNAGAYPTDGLVATEATFSAIVGGAIPPIADYLRNSLPACLMQGNGLRFTNESGFNWFASVEEDLTSVRTLYAQECFDLIDWWPGCGDPFSFRSTNTGGFDGPMELRAGKILHGQGWGEVWKLSDVASPTVTVCLKQSSTCVATGITDAFGVFLLGLNYGKGGQSYKLEAQSGPSPYPSISYGMWYARHRHRGCFRVDSPIKVVNPWNLEMPDGTYHRTGRTSGASGGNVHYFRSDFSVPLPYWAVNSVEVTTVNKDFDPRMQVDFLGRILLLFARKTGATYDVYETISHDYGDTWEAETLAIAGGKHPTIAVHPDGGVVRAAFITASNKIQSTFQASGDVSQSAATTWKDNTAADMLFEDDTFHLQPAYEDAGRWLLSCLIKTETDTSDWYSSDNDATTWTRIT